MRTSSVSGLGRRLTGRRVPRTAVALGTAAALVAVSPAVASASVASHPRVARGVHAVAGSGMSFRQAPAGLRMAVHKTFGARGLVAGTDPLKKELTDSDGGYFGNTVAISGSTAVVGAEFSDSGDGAAYVYTKSTTGVWSLQAELTDPAATASDRFGEVAISGNTLVVGAFGNNANTGAAYVFTRSGTTWTQQATLTASDAAPGLAFGESVAIAKNTAVIGSPGYAGLGTGQAYIFQRNATGHWSQKAELTDPAHGAGDYYGVSVAITGSTVAVGADGTGSGGGSAYVWASTGGVWAQQLALNDNTAGDNFGSSVAIAGGITPTMVVGAMGYNSGHGKIEVYSRSGTTWTSEFGITDTNPDNFGSSVAISVKSTTDTIVAGAPNANSGAGVAGVFTATGSTWATQGTLTAADGAAGDNFGVSAAISGTSALIGAPYHNSGNGATYLYKV